LLRVMPHRALNPQPGEVMPGADARHEVASVYALPPALASGLGIRHVHGVTDGRSVGRAGVHRRPHQVKRKQDREGDGDSSHGGTKPPEVWCDDPVR
jgi:hypothetical protein